MSQHYSDPARETDPHALPDVEVYYHRAYYCAARAELVSRDEKGGCVDGESCDPGDHENRDGFYWQSCFPGCLPDGDPCGPFNTEAEASADAQGRGATL